MKKFALLFALLLAVAVRADVETTAVPSSAGGGGSFNGGSVTALTEFSGQTNISGPDATTNVEIGSTSNDANAGTGGTSVVIGNNATNASNGAGQVVIGSGASGGTGTASNNVVVGSLALTGSNVVNATAIGPGAVAGTNSTSVGTNSNSSGIANHFVAGSSGVAMNNVFFGKGITNATATAYTINGTGGSGADNAGAALNLAGGRPTGTGRGGNVVLQAAPSGATSSTLQALEDRNYVVAQRFALTDNTIATFSTMTLGDDTVGGGTISYCVVSRDATTSASECGHVDYGGLDVTAGAGGEVCPTPTKHGTPLQILSGATLAVTFAASTGTDLCNIGVTADTNIATPAALYIVWNASNPGGRTLTPQ
jgi:hypothetical protein